MTARRAIDRQAVVMGAEDRPENYSDRDEREQNENDPGHEESTSLARAA